MPRVLPDHHRLLPRFHCRSGSSNSHLLTSTSPTEARDRTQISTLDRFVSKLNLTFSLLRLVRDLQCGSCQTILCQPRGGKARLQEGEFDVSRFPQPQPNSTSTFSLPSPPFLPFLSNPNPNPNPLSRPPSLSRNHLALTDSHRSSSFPQAALSEGRLKPRISS